MSIVVAAERSLWVSGGAHLWCVESVPRCSLRRRCGARHPRHARAMRCAARGYGWLRASHLLRCAAWLGVARSGRESRLANRTGKLDLGARRLNVSVALRIERDDTDRRPVTRGPTPASRVAFPRTLIDRVAGFEQTAIPSGMTLCRGNIADAAVSVLVVVPLHELHRPLAGSHQIGEPLERELGTIFRSASAKALSSLTRGRE